MEKNPLDISLVEDLLEGVMNLISLESHLYNSWTMTKQDYNLKLLDRAREIRTRWLSMLVKEGNQKDQRWCESKHYLESAMRLREVGTRFLQTKQIKEAKQCFVDSSECIMSFLELNGYLEEENVSRKTTKTSA